MFRWEKSEFPSSLPKLFFFSISPPYHEFNDEKWCFVFQVIWFFTCFWHKFRTEFGFQFQSARQLFTEMIILVNNWSSGCKWYICGFIHGFNHDFARINNLWTCYVTCHISLLLDGATYFDIFIFLSFKSIQIKSIHFSSCPKLDLHRLMFHFSYSIAFWPHLIYLQTIATPGETFMVDTGPVEPIRFRIRIVSTMDSLGSSSLRTWFFRSTPNSPIFQRWRCNARGRGKQRAGQDDPHPLSFFRTWRDWHIRSLSSTCDPPSAFQPPMIAEIYTDIVWDR